MDFYSTDKGRDEVCEGEYLLACNLFIFNAFIIFLLSIT